MKKHQHPLYVLFLLGFILFTPVALAHRSPEGCTGSGLGMALSSDKSQTTIGDIVSYDLDIFNGIGVGPIVCDTTDIITSITTPDGQIHPIILLRTLLTNEQSDFYPNVVTYIARTEDVNVDGRTLRATATISGSIHQNDTDSEGGGNQGVNVEVIAVPTSSGGGGGIITKLIPSISINKIPNPLALPFGPDSVTYDYTVWNTGGQQYLVDVVASDDKCSPLVLYAGDVNVNTRLDLGENWKYACTTTLSITTTNIATAVGYGDNNERVTANATATVIVSQPVISQIDTPIIFPTLPNTGFPPREESEKSKLITLAIIVLIVSSFSIRFLSNKVA